MRSHDSPPPAQATGRRFEQSRPRRASGASGGAVTGIGLHCGVCRYLSDESLIRDKDFGEPAGTPTWPPEIAKLEAVAANDGVDIVGPVA